MSLDMGLYGRGQPQEHAARRFYPSREIVDIRSKVRAVVLAAGESALTTPDVPS